MNRLAHTTAASLLVFALGATPARAQKRAPTPASLLAQTIEASITADVGSIPNVRVGISVIDLLTNAPIYERSASTGFNIASNTKIITASAALFLLGPDHRFDTAIFADKFNKKTGLVEGNIFLRGEGDPTLNVEALRALARSMRRAGVREIRGGVVVDDTYFDDKNSPPLFASQPDEDAAFRAPISAVALTFNSVLIIVSPANSTRRPARVEVIPANDHVIVRGVVKTVSSGRTHVRLRRRQTTPQLVYEVSGQIRREAAPRHFRYRIEDPVVFAGSAFRKLMIETGISVRGKGPIVAGVIPETASQVATHTSSPLAIIVRGMGKYSNNFVAEMLLKDIGAETRANDQEPATWEDGIGAVRAFLAEKVGLTPNSFRYDNGSGLFDSNEFSPRQIVSVLATAHRSFRYGPDFIASLSIAGVDGTLRRRMARDPARGLVRAKTGTLDSVSSLSGYAAVDGRAPLAFSILVNDLKPRRTSPARKLQDDVAKALIRYLKALPKR